MDLEKKRFLLELGCEELPDKQIDIAIQSIENSFNSFLAGNRLKCDVVQVSGTPRRIYLDATGLDATQEDEILEKLGPAIAIAYTKEGALSQAGMGFLRKCNATGDAIYTLETEKGSFVAVRQENKGKTTAELLQSWIPNAILQIPFGKKMIWCDTAFSFSRPLRWILTLWDSAPLAIDFYGIPNGKLTYGNRYLGLDKAFAIDDANSYLPCLKKNKVIADSQERRQMIVDQLNGIFAGTGMQVMEDNRLVDTVNNLVEYPHAVIAQFEAKYLALPEKIIISTISQNQKYFSAKSADGKLSNSFVFISNGDPDCALLIRKGNEKVVNARLADALWYFKEDTAKPLESFTPKLKNVVFQSQLGTLADKTGRIIKLATRIADLLQLPDSHKAKISRCALLCKADLVTTMLGEKEFTKLQGYIGKQYALATGEDAEIAEGIYEHYMPRGSADELPSTMCGKVVAIADKLDTVCGIIGVGMLPTGSGDPFALRRAANGIVQIISDNHWNIDFFNLADYSCELIAEQTKLVNGAKENIHSFLDQRITGLLKTQGIAYDVIDSVMHINKSLINDLENRAKALNSLKSHEDFIKLVIGFKRVSNIISETREFAAFSVQLMQDESEKDLYHALQVLHKAIDEALATKDYPLALLHLIRFGTKIDTFFDDVLVNCDDSQIRANRHALLLEIRKQFLRVADLSLIVLDANGEV